MLNQKINKYKTQIINNVYLNILISFFKLLKSVEYYIKLFEYYKYEYTCFTCDFKHNLIGNCKLYKRIFAFNS